MPSYSNGDITYKYLEKCNFSPSPEDNWKCYFWAGTFMTIVFLNLDGTCGSNAV